MSFCIILCIVLENGEKYATESLYTVGNLSVLKDMYMYMVHGPLNFVNIEVLNANLPHLYHIFSSP